MWNMRPAMPLIAALKLFHVISTISSFKQSNIWCIVTWYLMQLCVCVTLESTLYARTSEAKLF